MKLIKISKIEKKVNFTPSKSAVYTCKVPISFEFDKILVLDEVYSSISLKYFFGSNQLEFDLSQFPDFFQESFISYVEKNELYVFLLKNGNSEFKQVVSYLINDFLPNKYSHINDLLRPAKISIEGEKIWLNNSVLDLINANLSKNEREELKILFCWNNADMICANKPIYISIHVKNNPLSNEVKESDLYIKRHHNDVGFPLVVMLDGKPYTMNEYKEAYMLPSPSKFLFDKLKFDDDEKISYEKLHNVLNLLSSELLDIPEEENSVVGGYSIEDLQIEDTSGNIDYGDIDKWIHLLSLSSYSHWSDLFDGVGDGIMNILVDKSSLDKEDLIPKFILT